MQGLVLAPTMASKPSSVYAGPAKVMFSKSFNCMLAQLSVDQGGGGAATPLDEQTHFAAEGSHSLAALGHDGLHSATLAEWQRRPPSQTTASGGDSSGQSTPTLGRSRSLRPEQQECAAAAPRSRIAAAKGWASGATGRGALPLTMMLGNMPLSWSRDAVVAMLDAKGFKGQYDFVYVPMNFRAGACAGYSFVNLSSTEAARRFVDVFHGCTDFSSTGTYVGLSKLQGLDANVAHYRDSPVMNEAVPDEYKPALFRDGRQVDFPPPTKPLRRIRLRLKKKP